MTITKFDIEKFDGNISFGLWRVRMLAVLTQNDLKIALKGKEKKPQDMSDSDWEQLDEKALTAIQLCLTDTVLKEVLGETTAAGLWLKLESLYMTKSLTNRLILKERLYTLRMTEGTSIKSHISEFSSIIVDLQNLEVIIEDEDQALILLCSLPPSYKHLREIILYGRETISIEDVKQSLLSKDMIDNNLVGSSSTANSNQNDALFARGRPKERESNSGHQKSRSKSRHKNLTCNFCKKKGHIKTDCYALKRKQQNQNNGNKDQKNQNTAEASIAEDDGFVLSVIDQNRGRNKEEWILDSGASYHMCINRDWFTTYRPFAGGEVFMANDTLSKAVGIGSIRIKMHHDGVVRTITNVRHMTGMSRNLISLGTLDDSGYIYAGEGGVLKVTKGALTVMKGRKVGTLYVLEGSTVTGTAAVASSMTESDTTRLWHMRLGHMSERGMDLLSKRGLLCGLITGKLDFCEHCVLGKQKRVAFSTTIHRTKGTLDYIHSDLWGPSQVTSKGGAQYMVTFIDDFSRKVWVYFLKAKNEVFATFKQWKCMIEKQTCKQIKRLRTDNGLELCSGEFNAFCDGQGIVRHRTVRHTPQQNGVAESMNKTLLEKARCMLLNASLCNEFWAEAVSMACYLVNRSPSTAIGCKTPEEVFTGTPADYSNLKIFGCPAYMHVSEGKLEPRAKKCIFLGYSAAKRNYRY
jgi:hypothetical protein